MARFQSSRRMLFSFFGWLCLFASTTNAVAADNDSNTIQNDLISWVRSKGGSFSDKLEIRRVDPADPTSYMGVFVREPIEAKESLFVVPRDCYIQVFDTAQAQFGGEFDSTTTEVYHADLCKLATKLMDEMKLGDDSEYAPYIAYLKTQKPGQLPANWSPQGKELLRKVAIPGSPMVDWIDWSFRGPTNNCAGPKSNDSSSAISFEEHMVEMTIQRCFDVALIPIWDMVNHDNGRINTENDSMHDPEGMKVRAYRNLEAGEEIFASYDDCVDCQDLTEYWGTPEILKDFGFVENYPHRWIFSEQRIWIEVYEDYDFQPFWSGRKGGLPSDEQLAFLTQELKRLKAMKPLLEQGSIPDHEFFTIQKYHQVAMTDLDEVVWWYTENAEEAAAAAAASEKEEL